MVLIIHLPPMRIGIGAMREKALHKVEVPEAQIKGRLIEDVKFATTPDSNIGICAELEEQFYHGPVSDRLVAFIPLLIPLLLSRPQQTRVIDVDTVLASACAHQSRYASLAEIAPAGPSGINPWTTSLNPWIIRTPSFVSLTAPPPIPRFRPGLPVYVRVRGAAPNLGVDVCAGTKDEEDLGECIRLHCLVQRNIGLVQVDPCRK